VLLEEAIRGEAGMEGKASCAIRAAIIPRTMAGMYRGLQNKLERD
jgi:hypothetical protein